MKATIALLIVFVVIFVLINIGFGFLERYLARKSEGLGKIMPIFFFIVAVMAMVNSVEQAARQMLEYGRPVATILVLAGVFVFLNIPTIVTYVVYRKVRKK